MTNHFSWSFVEKRVLAQVVLQCERWKAKVYLKQLFLGVGHMWFLVFNFPWKGVYSLRMSDLCHIWYMYVRPYVYGLDRKRCIMNRMIIIACFHMCYIAFNQRFEPYGIFHRIFIMHKFKFNFKYLIFAPTISHTLIHPPFHTNTNISTTAVWNIINSFSVYMYL